MPSLSSMYVSSRPGSWDKEDMNEHRKMPRTSQAQTSHACKSSALWVRWGGASAQGGSTFFKAVRQMLGRNHLPQNPVILCRDKGVRDGRVCTTGWPGHFHHPIQSLRLLVSVPYPAQRKSGMRAQDRNGFPPPIPSGNKAAPQVHWNPGGWDPSPSAPLEAGIYSP